jgi:hypothetical protein
MIEFILTTAIIVGKADISSFQTQYEILTQDGQIVTVIDDNSEVHD